MQAELLSILRRELLSYQHRRNGRVCFRELARDLDYCFRRIDECFTSRMFEAEQLLVLLEDPEVPAVFRPRIEKSMRKILRRRSPPGLGRSPSSLSPSPRRSFVSLDSPRYSLEVPDIP